MGDGETLGQLKARRGRGVTAEIDENRMADDRGIESLKAMDFPG